MFISLFVHRALADILAGTYPALTDLTSVNSFIARAWKNPSTTYDRYLKNNQTSASASLLGREIVTFSVRIFSTYDAAPAALRYHHIAPEIANSVNGTEHVDGDANHNMASVSKLFTVFAGMLE